MLVYGLINAFSLGGRRKMKHKLSIALALLLTLIPMAAGMSVFAQDTTPPETTLTIGQPKFVSVDTYVGPTTLFTLTATDDISGVAHIYYKIDLGSYTEYTAPFDLALFKNGVHTISYYSVDNDGNEETANTADVKLCRSNDNHGDLTGDDIVDIFDIVMAAGAYGTHPGDPNWNPLADFDDDGAITIFDIASCIYYWTD
jgi:hypothetical protein